MVAFAYLVLLAWPAVTAVLFARLPIERAVVWSILAGYLLLPFKVGLKVPMLPGYTKELVPAAAALAMCLLMDRSRRGGESRRWLPRNRLLLVLLLLYLFSPILTVATNQDAFVVGPRFVPGLRPYDVGAMFYGQLTEALPFILALRYLQSEASQQFLVKGLVIAAAAYTAPILLELRLSPQLNNFIYGFYQFKFVHEVRAGFRPVVFLEGGLWTAMFLAMAVVAAAAWWRAAAGRERMLAMAVTGWLSLILALMSSLGAFLLALVMAPAARFLPRALLGLAILGVAGLVVLYPAARGVGVVPTQSLVEAAASINERRAGSLQFRFDNEDRLMARANERALFGWGGWGRNRVYDQRTGGDTTTTDGRWIIVFGVFGWVGYVAETGLLAMPLLIAGWRAFRGRLSIYTAGLCLALSVAMIDMLLNGTLTPVVWLAAGAVMARMQVSAAEPGAAEAIAAPRVRRLPTPVIGALPAQR